MSASEESLVYREDTDSFRNLRVIGAQEESSYVDLNDLLELKLDDTKAAKVTFTDDLTQRATIKSISDKRDSNQDEYDRIPSAEKIHESNDTGCLMDCKPEKSTGGVLKPAPAGGNDTGCTASPAEDSESAAGQLENTDDQYNDIYLSSKSESDDEATVVLSDHGTPDILEDESHYITTHEIQLLELDHDVDYDVETGSSWDVEDDHQVYSFVDYAFFDSDETIVTKEASNASNGAKTSGAGLSGKPEGNLCDENLPKKQNTSGQIHLSIKATSRAIHEPSAHRHGKQSGDISRCVLKGVDAKGDKVCDNAKCFIAVPGRLHLGSKLKSKDAHEYSSGASSAVSELDDADKEVRNLTARSFRSLAYPYFDGINFSTSSESSASEHGLGINRWSTFVDLKYGNVNTSNGQDQNLLAHKDSTSNFHFAKKRDGRGITGLTLTSMRAPPVEIFALNGSLVGRKNASSTTKKIELMGKFSHGQSGVIRLTETLNFRCNIKSGQPGNERRVKSAQNTGGSRSADEVSNTLPSAQGSEASKRLCNPDEGMEDTHKKAIFASSLLKNVISKKMQFEQERKMERGEIRETHRAPSPRLPTHEHEAQQEKVTRKHSQALQRQSSRLSEADSDFTIVCVDELGDIVDSDSSAAKHDSRKEETLTSASETNLESANDTKTGALEASKSALLPSQNSAFRSWKDGELEFQREHKSDKTPEGKLPPPCQREANFNVDSKTSKHTKMSHLFVPGIQPPSVEREFRKAPPNTIYSARDQGESRGMKLRPDTLYVSDATSSAVPSKSPEIKISVRSVRDNRSDPFSIAKLLTPNIGCNAAGQMKTVDESRCHALAAALKGESSDKVPHFIVRDIRDNKGKLQTPIHQVRDVRKLVKSSYHFVSLDSHDKSTHFTSDGEQKTLKQSPYLNSASLSPIVIKCQSVNTNSNVKQSGNLVDSTKRRYSEDASPEDRSPQVPIEGAKNENTQIQKLANRLPLDNTKQEVTAGSAKQQDKTNDISEKKNEPKIANQAALEKLQAAVKTMEQLYVFDKNEWKRKTEPQPITGSHVLSLIASEEHEGTLEEQESIVSSAPMTNTFRLVRQDSNSEKPTTQSEMATKKEEKETPKTSTTPVTHKEKNDPRALMQLPGTASKRTMLGQSLKPSATATSSIKPQTQVSLASSHSCKGVTPKSPKLPVCLKISQPKRVMKERERPNGSETEFAPLQFTSTADSENYLTIPVKPHVTATRKPTTAGLGKTSVYTISATGGKTQSASSPSYLSHREIHQSPKRSSIVMETRSPDTPTATVYHTALPVSMPAAQPQVICFSPTVHPSPVPAEHFQPTQRKMLLDPTTGNYYLVDTPVQPATRRLFDPETGQFVDIPMPQQPPMTPVPLPVSPLALGAGAYGHTYMFYPGYMPTTVIPARTISSQLCVQSEAEDKSHSQIGQQEEGAYMESSYYMPSGKSSQTASVAQHITTSSKQPVISITSQQGPRIIAPPSFDGTTMSFVVEHR